MKYEATKLRRRSGIICPLVIFHTKLKSMIRKAKAFKVMSVFMYKYIETKIIKKDNIPKILSMLVDKSKALSVSVMLA